MKIIRNILLIIVGIFLLFFSIGLMLGKNNENETNDYRLDNYSKEEIESKLYDVRNDSWTDTHLATYNNKSPETLKKQIGNKRIYVRSKIMSKDFHYFFIGVDESVNIKCELKDQDDFDKLRLGQNVILEGDMTTGKLPWLKDVVIIDTMALKNRFKKLN